MESDWRGHAITVRDMPALQCSGCARVLFTPEAVDLVADFVDAKITSQERVPDVMTVEEAARFLRVSTHTVYNLQRTGRLPGGKIGGQLRFLREALLEALSPVGAAPGRESSGRGQAAKGDLRKIQRLLQDSEEDDTSQDS